MTTTVQQPTWLQSPEGFVRLQVLKPFLFIHRVVSERDDGMTLMNGRERRFTVGEHLLDPGNKDDAEVLNHPWVFRDMADGQIEHPDATRKRLAEEEVRNKAEEERRKRLREEAEAALARTEVAAENAGQAGRDVQGELDTPLNQPRGRRQHKSTVRPPQVTDTAAELNAQLNTPLNELPKA